MENNALTHEHLPGVKILVLGGGASIYIYIYYDYIFIMYIMLVYASYIPVYYTISSHDIPNSVSSRCEIF